MFSLQQHKFDRVLPGVKSLLPVHVLHRLHCLPLGKFSLFEIFVRMQLKYQIDGGAAVWFKKEPRKIYDLDALDSGV